MPNEIRPAATTRYAGVDVDLFVVDDLLWILKDQAAAALQRQLPTQPSYYGRHFTPWSTRIVSVASASDVRVFSLYGAVSLARRISTPHALEFAEHFDQMDRVWTQLLSLQAVAELPIPAARPALPATRPSPRSNSPRGAAA